MKVFILLFLSLLNAEKIELKDGTVIYGDFEGLIEDNYVIRTKYGILSVKKEDILYPDSENIIIKQTDNIKNNKDLRIITKKIENGYKRFFYENGVIIATQTFINNELITEGNIKDGVYYEFDENDNMIAEKTIKNGIENGTVIEFYPSGIIKSKINFKDGKIHGKAYFYTEDSKLILEQSFENGVLEGYSIEYNLDGNIKSKILYHNGKLAETNEEKKEENKENTQNEPVISTETLKIEEITTKKINLARGKKIFVYKNNKYIGSFTFDNEFNILDITGSIPDGEIEVKESKYNIIFQFLNNWVVSLKVMKGGIIEKEYLYKDDGKSVLKK